MNWLETFGAGSMDNAVGHVRTLFLERGFGLRANGRLPSSMLALPRRSFVRRSVYPYVSSMIRSLMTRRTPALAGSRPTSWRLPWN